MPGFSWPTDERLPVSAGLNRVTVVIPCLNEEEAIGDVVREVLAQDVAGVIVVDNGSTDSTAAVAREAGARVVAEPGRGYGRACAAGVAAAAKDGDAGGAILCFLDGDGSDVPAFIAAVVWAGCRGPGRFCHGFAPARQARARQPDPAAGAGRPDGRDAAAPDLWGALHRHVAAARHPRTDCLAALDMREQHLRLEP